nr:TPA_asm: PLA2X [Spodoptera moth adintovirus 2]
MCFGESSLLNWLINNIPFELHLPGYNYCGPGTKLIKRLTQGDNGINKLDEYCKDHDIAYHKSSNLKDRHKADLILLKMARERAVASDANIGEKLAARLVSKAMLAKIKTGSGLNKKHSPKIIPGKGLKSKLKSVITKAKRHIKKLKPKTKKMAIELAIAATRELADDSSIKLPRIIPIPKTGGVLPLIPIFAGLSAAGALAGGAAGIAKTINEFKMAKKLYEESKRHNEKMEALCIGKGLHLKPHKGGLGIFVSKEKN